jgi:hypothetical protein
MGQIRIESLPIEEDNGDKDDRMDVDEKEAPAPLQAEQNDDMQVDNVYEEAGDVLSFHDSEDEASDVGDEIHEDSSDDAVPTIRDDGFGTPAKDVEWDTREFGYEKIFAPHFVFVVVLTGFLCWIRSPEAELNLRGLRGLQGLSKRLHFGEVDEAAEGDADDDDPNNKTLGELILQMDDVANEEQVVFALSDSEDEGDVEFSEDSSFENDVEFSVNDDDDDDDEDESEGAVDFSESDMAVDEFSPVKSKRKQQAKRRGNTTGRTKRKRTRKTPATEAGSERIIDLPAMNPKLQEELLSSPVKQPGTPTKMLQITDRALWEAARTRLTHLVAPEKGGQLAGREFQHTQIKESVVSALETQLGGSMFVHGIPGTGKTATVRLIMNQLIHSQEYDFNCTI